MLVELDGDVVLLEELDELFFVVLEDEPAEDLLFCESFLSDLKRGPAFWLVLEA